MKPIIWLFLLLLVLTIPKTVWSQANEAPTATADLCRQFPGSLSAEDLARYAETCKQPETETLPRSVTLSVPALCDVSSIEDKSLAKELQTACVGDLKDAIDFNAKMREHNVKLYTWQADASDDMRILVWVVVLAGIAMAVYQLAIIMQIELWRARRKGPAEAPILGEQGLELGLGKVQITSSVTGVIVLALSIAFLYLYLTEVYPIKPPPG